MSSSSESLPSFVKPPLSRSPSSSGASSPTYRPLLSSGSSANFGKLTRYRFGLSNGVVKRLGATLVVGVVCIIGFSHILPESPTHYVSSLTSSTKYSNSIPPEFDPGTVSPNYQPPPISSFEGSNLEKYPQYPSYHYVPPTHLYPLPSTATLDDRIEAWRNAPGRNWEPADFVAWNLQTCGDVIPNHNRDLIAKASLIWAVMNSSTILDHRERMVQHLLTHRKNGAFDDPVHVTEGGTGLVGHGRGMVFTAGNADTLRRVVWSLTLMRNYYNSTLPAAVYHFPSEAPDADDPIRAKLASLNARLVSATSRTKDSTRTKNYHLKAQAIVESPWREVLYLDSDNLPALKPEEMFEERGYKRLGAMFWPDYWKTSANNPIWAILGVQCRDEWEQEAGQIVIDKARHLDALLLSAYMLQDWQFWYYFSDGDKDVFRFSFLALRKRWALPGRWVGAAGLPSGTASGEFCAHTMQQYDAAGRPAFVHYNLLKQIPSGVGRGFSWGRTKQVQKLSWEYAGPGKMHDPPVLLRPITKHEFMDAKLNWTDPWFEEGSRSWSIEERYKRYPYPDPDREEFVRRYGKARVERPKGGKKGAEILRRGGEDVEADMLANVRDDGRGIMPADDEVRRRASMERGLRPFFHGGVISALCIDVDFEDPYGGPREANTVQTSKDKVAPNELGIDWGISPLEIAQWDIDPRLKDIEDWMYDEGFIPNSDGF